MNTTKEKIKTVVLLVLIAGMIYLTYSVWFFDSPFGDAGLLDSFFGNGGGDEFIQESDGGDIGRFGISPLGILIRDDSGARGIVCNSSHSDEIYITLRNHISEILNTAGETETISNEEWQAAILKNGIFLDYRGNVPIGALRLWVGAKQGASAVGGRFYFISTAERNAELYIKSNSSDVAYKIKSGKASSDIDGAIASISASKAYFALENDEYKSIMPEAIIAEKRDNPTVLEAYNAMSVAGVKNVVLDAFRLLDGTPSTYMEQDGTEVHIADMVTLKFSPEGVASYSDPRGIADETLGIEVESESSEPSFAEKIEAARVLCSKIASFLPGAGGIYLIDAASSGEETEIVFGRHVQGVPVDMKDTVYFAKIIIKDKIISAARINLRCYDATAQTSDVISEKLATAALSGIGKSGEINLRYEDIGQNTIYPAWFVGGTKKSEEAK